MKNIKSKPAGYSGKPLIDKLGLKEGMNTLILYPPKNYFSLLGDLPDGIRIKKQPRGLFDFIHLFTAEAALLERDFPIVSKTVAPKGMLWISWPKGSSGIATDLDENIVREIGLKTNLVDIKVAAIDEIWSGLKFVHRKEKRTI